MRIVGGRDYYDGAGYGVDSSVVFVREAEAEILRIKNMMNIAVNSISNLLHAMSNEDSEVDRRLARKDAAAFLKCVDNHGF